ncbi:AAA family ATPase [Streptantibioticus ferralitis]|uniref:ATP-binding protein n=1 Tax=Streptantibioticus ferralitis TaxID=236510 RepID=A0ABT5Z1J5_9ACTN|nr:ATP-binding protein [Streptantibioticus ferralitis]MDF2257638.1 ATP-binding protein [Streptantibioticus ferralitis]
MLLSFRVANHRSIRDEQELSLVATEFNEGTGRETGTRSEGKPVRVLPAIGIFGANASGKSNVLSAMRFMREAVIESLATWGKGQGVPRQPFELADEASADTSLFEVELLLGRADNKTRYTYGFELSDDRVESEWLHAYPSGRRQVWFEREANRPETEGGEFRFPGTGLSGRKDLKDLLVTTTRSNALFLTVGAALNHPQLSAIHRWFQDNLWLVTSGSDVEARTAWTRELLTRKEAKEMRDRLVTMLASADLGVTDVDVDAESGEVQLLHRGADGSSRRLDFWEQESLGTHAWFAFLGPLLHLLGRRGGGVLLADELDSSLHPVLAAEVVRFFQDAEANPELAQLIFTTHDATLLGPSVVERPLDRDQVWLTVKQREGESALYPLLAARKARNDENLERRYLRGYYGGVPRLTTGEVARQLAALERRLEAQRTESDPEPKATTTA